MFNFQIRKGGAGSDAFEISLEGSLDHITGELDVATAIEVFGVLRRVNEELGVTAADPEADRPGRGAPRGVSATSSCTRPSQATRCTARTPVAAHASGCRSSAPPRG